MPTQKALPSISRRTNTQKAQLAAARANRKQEGGSGLSTPIWSGSSTPILEEALVAQTSQLKATEATLQYTKNVLEKTKHDLELERAHSVDLYNSLRVVRRKQQRSHNAKLVAMEKTMENMTLVDELKTENETLEERISELLQNSNYSEEQQQEAKRKIKALQMRCKRASEFIDLQLERTKANQATVSLMEKGVYTEEARELCRIMVGAGCSAELVGETIEAIFSAVGITFTGPRISRRTVGRAVLEGGVMSDLQLAQEILKTEGLTMSSDGTTHKHVNFESRHIHLKVPTYNSEDSVEIHKSRLVGVDSATDHSSETQLEGWKTKINDLLELYNQSPLSHRCQVALTVSDFFARLCGMSGDHAKDQKKLAKLLEETKQFFLKQTLGKNRLLGMNSSQFLELLIKVNNKVVRKVGGETKWNNFSEVEKLSAEAECLSEAVLEIGAEVYSQLDEKERERVDLFVWTGCAMHKDLNCVKGGDAAMRAWWEENNTTGPILLANKDNAAVLQHAENIEEPTAIEQRAFDSSSGGGVKLASLAGMLFRNKDDKVGQQDTYQQFFLSRQQHIPKFPDTSNTRYQSHCGAAAQLIVWLDLHVAYLEWIRDGKEKPGFTNLEKNVYLGLQDIPTQTELAVLALYAQAVSHPYMRKVRGSGTEHTNMLDLGPLHSDVQRHIEKIIQNPSILMLSQATYQLGTMDGKPWHNSEVVEAVHRLAPTLPYLKSVLIAFCKGALETWKRFSTEFEEGGKILGLSTSEKDRAWRPPTNDVNEGALGSLRSHMRKKPNTTILQFNALKKFKFNQTSAFVKREFLPEDFAFVHKVARDLDARHLERERKAELIAYKDKQIAKRREKQMQKARKQAEKEAFLATVNRVKNVEDVTDSMKVKELDDQLEIYRKLVDDTPLKSKLKNKSMKIEALQNAIRQFNAQEKYESEEDDSDIDMEED